MKENLEKFLEAASSDEALGQEVKALNESIDSKEEVVKGAIELAHKHGFELEETDFEGAISELDDDELDEVAGGSACACASMGVGLGGWLDNACGCFGSGYGSAGTGTNGRCMCVAAGGGSSKE